MRWRVHGRETRYESRWVNVYVDDVELPDGRHIDHHVLTMPRASVGSIVLDDHDRTLLIWRHRFITDKWGWEVPAGWADPAEDLIVAARREIEEETGWRPRHMERMADYHPLSGISTMHYTAFVATGADYVGEPSDREEVDRAEWVALDEVPDLAAAGLIADGPSLLILSYYLAMHRGARASCDGPGPRRPAGRTGG